ncbi:DoxX family protein [Cognaticolwellia mytili]|uniref:DoxX family protein n=1 Tax=Cognaticolwellia mytili TaxID=1888913 RepID=UPI000A1763E9|nr:DoxX family protein [Cognaticolwellia mytili]
MIILTILLAFFFIFASSIKILGWQKFIFESQLAFFKKYGLNRLQMLLIGIAELAAALLLISSIYLSNELLNGVGSIMIAFTSIGAIYFHLRFDTIKDAIPAMVTLVLSTILIVSNQVLLSLTI